MKALADAKGGVVLFPFASRQRKVVAQALAEGRVMSYPTETSYALGGNAMDSALAAEIFRLKGRKGAKALLLLIDGEDQAQELGEGIDPAAQALMRACWPGALTLVVPATPGLPAHLRDGRDTVALRHSPHPVVAESMVRNRWFETGCLKSVV